MRNMLATVALAAMICGPAVMPTAALAQSSDNNYRHEHVYRGKGGHYRHRCGSGNGAVGTVAGGVGGGVIGHALIGGPVGTVAGAVGGGLLGRHLDKKHTRARHGC